MNKKIVLSDTKGLKPMLFAEFGCCAALFLLTLVYFPTKPPTPPTITASVDRLEFKKGLKQLLQLRPPYVNSLTFFYTYIKLLL